ncbi:MAG: alpha/beta fold hydrolase [Chloroflexota bacterium]
MQDLNGVTTTLKQVPSGGISIAVHEYSVVSTNARALPIFLLPGLIVGDLLWRDTIPFLSTNGFSVRSIRDPTASFAPSLDRLRMHIVDVLDAFALPRVILCGNSIGGMLAADLAATFPERVAAILVSGAPGLDNEFPIDVGAQRTFDRETVYRLARRIVHNEERIPSEEVDTLRTHLNNRSFQRNLVTSLHHLRRYNAGTIIPQIQCPMLLVWGENDSLTSRSEWERQTHTRARSTFHVIPDCGHAPMFECADIFNPHLLTFLMEVCRLDF